MANRTLLLVNKFYHDTGPAGGVGRYMLQEEEDLLAAGWQVIPFAMADADARASRWRPYFVKAHDYSTPRWSSRVLSDASSLIWNREAARNLDALLQVEKPDIAHLHNIYHHLTPSILPVLERHGIPVVMTLHDLRLLCPAIHMLQAGQVCERCRGGRFQEAVKGRCVKDSRAASLLAALETWHQHRRGLYVDHVQRFICPSKFYLDKYAEWGYPRTKLTHLPNFVDTTTWRPSDSEPEDAYLYFGRISREKGLGTLLRAQALWEAEAAESAAEITPPTLFVAGSGPWAGELRRMTEELKLKTVEILGALSPGELRDVLDKVQFTVLPSEWYENAPMALLESLATGRPVVGADIGGIPELITEGEDGILFRSGDPVDLLDSLKQARELGPAARTLARAKAVQQASRPEHMLKLQNIISDVLG